MVDRVGDSVDVSTLKKCPNMLSKGNCRLPTNVYSGILRCANYHKRTDVVLILTVVLAVWWASDGSLQLRKININV